MYETVLIGTFFLGATAYVGILGWLAYRLIVGFITDSHPQMPDILAPHITARADGIGRYRSTVPDTTIDAFCLFKVGIPGFMFLVGGSILWPITYGIVVVWYARERYRDREVRKAAREVRQEERPIIKIKL